MSRTPPDLPERPTVSLHALGVEASAVHVLDALTAQFAQGLEVWRRTGLAATRASWLDRAHPPGTPLSAALPDGTRIEGRFDGLTDDCALRLAMPGGSTQVIHAGDVFLL